MPEPADTAATITTDVGALLATAATTAVDDAVEDAMAALRSRLNLLGVDLGAGRPMVGSASDVEVEIRVVIRAACDAVLAEHTAESAGVIETALAGWTPP